MFYGFEKFMSIIFFTFNQKYAENSVSRNVEKKGQQLQRDKSYAKLKGHKKISDEIKL